MRWFVLALSVVIVAPIGSAAVIDITASPYNCVGDGTTDNRSCFQSALNAASSTNGAVYVPAGTFLFSSHSSGIIITNQSNVVIFGDGEKSVLKYGSFGSTDVELFKGTADNVTARDLTFDMNGTNNTVGATTPLKGAFRFGTGSDNITIERCTFRDASGARVISIGDGTPNSQTNIIIRQNRFIRVADTISGNSSMPDHSSVYAEADRLQVNDNQFVNDSQSIAATAIELHGRNAEAIGNQIKNYNLGVIVASIYGYTTYNMTVLGNQMDNVQGAVRAYIQNSNSLMNNLDIRDNVVQSSTAIYPFIDLGSAVINLGGDVSVVGNRLYYSGSALGSIDGPGVTIGRWTNVEIRGNQIRELNGRAIELDQAYPPNADQTSIWIADNKMHNTNRNTVGSGGAIAIYLSHSNRLMAARIIDNECSNPGTGSPADFAATPIVTCVDGSSPTRRLTIRGTMCSGPTTCQTWSGSAPTTLEADLTSQRVQLGVSTFSTLGTFSNGTLVYCSDCTTANPCAGSGTGALAKRINGAWVCN